MRKRYLSIFIAAIIFAFSISLSAQRDRLSKILTAHYENLSVIKEFQAGTIQTETENYSVQPVAKYNSLFSNYGLAGYVAYHHSGPFRHHLYAGGAKFIYGRYYTPQSSQTIMFEAMYGRNTERDSWGNKVSQANVFGLGVSGNFESNWIGASLGISAGQFMQRNDENVNFFSQGRVPAFDIFGRWRIRVLPHRWVFIEYSSNNLFLFQGGQGKVRQLALGSGMGLVNGSEMKAGYLVFLKSPGYFTELTLYFNNKYGAGVNYTIYEKGSRYISLKGAYRFGNGKFGAGHGN